jgi:predicted CXXCH cytochrome family protein
MKKILLLVVCMVLVASAAFAATIVGTKHDLSTAGAGTALPNTNQEICVFCHTPHNADATPLAPLWSHTSTTVATYQTYTNDFGTLQGAIGQPGSVSKACLSCHDGTVAVGQIGSGRYTGLRAAGTYAAGAFMTGLALFSADLSNDHPIGIVYDSTLDTGLTVNAAGLVGGTLPIYPSGANYTVECGSCHNVHDNTNAPFLRRSNTGSGLCLVCHIK